MSYMTISSQENHHFSLCSCFHAHPTTLLLKILGGTNAWAVPPTSNFGGDRPPSPPLGLRPWGLRASVTVAFASHRTKIQIKHRTYSQAPPASPLKYLWVCH